MGEEDADGMEEPSNVSDAQVTASHRGLLWQGAQGLSTPSQGGYLRVYMGGQVESGSGKPKGDFSSR